MVIEHHGKKPKIHPDAFVAETAVVIGDVTIGKDSSIWYGAILRGDINSITIGERTSIQDNCVVHVDEDKPVVVGDDVTVGHSVVLHGCKIGNKVLVGMGAVILDGAEIGDGAIVAAGAVVKEGQVVPPLTLVAGVPAQPKKKLDESVLEVLKEHAEKYSKYAKTYSKDEN